jgi:hypothetical protein
MGFLEHATTVLHGSGFVDEQTMPLRGISVNFMLAFVVRFW